MPFADALRAINAMKAEGVIEDYAIAGAMALVFWTEPVPTRDLDVLVFLRSGPGPLVSLEGIYRWSSARGYPVPKEHVIMEGVPTQFLASPGPLGDEAIQTAATLEYEDVRTRVVIPEYLVALYLLPEARTTEASMGSRSESASSVGRRPRPSAELTARLRLGKEELRRERERMSLPEKVRQVIELQKAVHPLLARRRELEPWERPWEIAP